MKKRKEYKMTNTRKCKMMTAMQFPAEIKCNYSDTLESVEIISTNKEFPNAIFDNLNGDAYDTAVDYAFCKALKWYLTRKARW